MLMHHVWRIDFNPDNTTKTILWPDGAWNRTEVTAVMTVCHNIYTVGTHYSKSIIVYAENRHIHNIRLKMKSRQRVVQKIRTLTINSFSRRSPFGSMSFASSCMAAISRSFLSSLEMPQYGVMSPTRLSAKSWTRAVIYFIINQDMKSFIFFVTKLQALRSVQSILITLQQERHNAHAVHMASHSFAILNIS